MSLILVSPPASLPIEESLVFDHLRLIDGGSSEPEDADYVRALIQNVVSEVDGRDGLLGRALITQTWALKLDSFPSCIDVPLPPLQAVASITYVDGDGVTQTLSSSAYRVSGIGGAWHAEIAPAPGTSWPSTSRVREAVTVTFTAGYGAGPENIPPALRGALLEAIATRYLHRASVSVGSGFSALPASALDSLDQFRVWRFR